MIKNIAIVSLSAGTIGEEFVKHEIEIGIKRLHDLGLNVLFMPHAMKGIEYIRKHPEKRAADLLEAFADDSIDMILCAIGGDDTYRLLPYLFEHDELRKALRQKVFLGFSDTTFNHFMLHKLGLKTFYGQSFLADICELDVNMLPYSEHYFRELISTGSISKITPSDVWYKERSDWSPNAVGTPRFCSGDRGFELLQGPPVFSGEILGGCIDSIFDMFDNTRYSDSVLLTNKYGLFPSSEDWKNKILLLETSEEQPTPERYREMLKALEKTGIFNSISGILCGKPMDEVYFDEYKSIIKEVTARSRLPIVANVNIGHATPRCIIPFGVHCTVDTLNQEIRFEK